MNGVSELKRDVVSACRILCEQKLVEGFGHVSARLPDSESFLLTPRISLALVEETDLLSLNLDGKIIEDHHPVPFEASLHTSIMKSKPTVNAITRIHARTANMFSVTDRKLDPVHNHGSFFSGGVPVFHPPDLISTEKLGFAVAATLAEKPAVLLRGKWPGNGWAYRRRSRDDGNLP